jgi:hypothetical protein
LLSPTLVAEQDWKKLPQSLSFGFCCNAELLLFAVFQIPEWRQDKEWRTGAVVFLDSVQELKKESIEPNIWIIGTNPSQVLTAPFAFVYQCVDVFFLLPRAAGMLCSFCKFVIVGSFVLFKSLWPTHMS